MQPWESARGPWALSLPPRQGRAALTPPVPVGVSALRALVGVVRRGRYSSSASPVGDSKKVLPVCFHTGRTFSHFPASIFELIEEFLDGFLKAFAAVRSGGLAAHRIVEQAQRHALLLVQALRHLDVQRHKQIAALRRIA